MATVEIEFTLDSGDYSADVEYEPYIPGKLSGPPENCYPPEGGCASVVKLWRDKTLIAPGDYPVDLPDSDALYEMAESAEDYDYCDGPEDYCDGPDELELCDRAADKWAAQYDF